jgi:subtilase family protein
MKRITYYLFLVILLFFSGQIISQTVTNTEKLLQISEELDAAWKEKEQRVANYIQKNDVPKSYQSQEGVFYEIIDIIDGKPIYYRTDNFGAATTTRAKELWVGGNSGLDISGDGYLQLGEWDAGAVRVTHQEFTDQGGSRVTQMDGPTATHYHATHVAGTMVAGGVVGNAKGMSYGGNLKAWQWSNDESEMAAAAAAGLEISNHSYGVAHGWDNNNGNWVWHGASSISPDEDYKFGFYDSGSRQWDQIAYNAPNYLIVKSAGNDRGDGPADAGNGEPEVDGGEDGYDCISPKGIAKNLLTVGAVYEVLDYTGPESVSMSDFSCWGPADDGRIKPDIVGKGVDVYSTMDGSNDAYGLLEGTSMSAPNVSGSMALLQFHYQDLNSEIMRASTLKALVLHSADEAGEHDGPDYIYGWGLMNTERAAAVISDNEGQNVIDEIDLSNGDTYSRDVTVPAGADFRVTICWTDVPGSPTSPQLNPSNPMLVNDLDLSIEDASQNDYYPYSLDRDNPSAAATTTGKNYVDNVEMIYIEGAEPGTYTITVDHDGTLATGGQAFSIIISGIDEYTSVPECSNGMISPENAGVNAFLNHFVTWKNALYANSYDVYFGTDGSGTSTPTNIYNGDNFTMNGFSTMLEENTTYYIQVAPRNSVGVTGSCTQIWSFTTMPAITVYPHLEDMESVIEPELPEFWQQESFTDADWFSTDIASHSDDISMACYNTSGFVKMDYNNWFISPPFGVEVGNEYNINFYYRALIGGNAESMTLYWGSTPYIEDLTNVLFEAVDFTNGDWEEANSMLIPQENGIMFLGFHLNGISGYGGFVDDVKVSDWGTVGINNNNSDEVRIYNFSGNITIKTTDGWSGSDIMVANLMGQNIYSGKLSGNKATISISDKTGLFIVSLVKNGNIITKKIILE